MANSFVAPKPNNRRRTKVKSGCGTCRIRRIKCDEDKPSCRKCSTTGRTCDGYESPFKHQAIKEAQYGSVISSLSLTHVPSETVEITPRDIELLNHYFSIKTLCGTQIFCQEAAKQILEASLTDPTVRHAISSLRALRNEFEAAAAGEGAASIPESSPNYQYGLEQYSIALRGLASNLANPSAVELKSALYCCPILISIEQARKNYAAMAHHIIGGLKIMREHRVRPYFASPGTLVPTTLENLPYLDVFIIKLFAAPCKFADSSPNTAHVLGTTSPPSSTTTPTPSTFRTLLPNMRTELLTIATSLLNLLAQVSHLESSSSALALLPQKAALLSSLDSWLANLDAAQVQNGSSRPEPISIYFMRFFHQTLKVVVLGTLHVDSSAEFHGRIKCEEERLLGVAEGVQGRVEGYVFLV